MKTSIYWKSFLIFLIIFTLAGLLFYYFGGQYVFKHQTDYFFPHFWAEVLASLISLALISYPAKLFLDHREKEKHFKHEKQKILSIFTIIQNELQEDYEKLKKVDRFVQDISKRAKKNYEKIENKKGYDKLLVSYANEIQILFHNRMGENLLNNTISFIHNPKSPYFDLYRNILENLMRYYDLNHRFRQSWKTIARYIEDYQKSLTDLYKNVYAGVSEEEHQEFKQKAKKFNFNLPDLEKHFLEHLNEQVEMKNYKINEFKWIVLQDYKNCKKQINEIIREINDLLKKVDAHS